MIDSLKHQWFQLAKKYTKDNILAESLWIEIKTQYELNARYYHNFSHIDAMLKQAEIYKEAIENHDAFLFAIWYHDIIYKPTKQDNEVQSAVLAKKRLKKLHLEQNTLENIEQLIISTKKHKILLGENFDNAFLLDIDLSILGSDWKTYQKYTENIRKEYRVYPSFIYNKGRKQVLQTFLERETLFFTHPYQSKFETQARKNILQEIKLL
jgi:predicted metal-dependent HD superfamily phosphohydrolase